MSGLAGMISISGKESLITSSALLLNRRSRDIIGMTSSYSTRAFGPGGFLNLVGRSTD